MSRLVYCLVAVAAALLLSALLPILLLPPPAVLGPSHAAGAAALAVTAKSTPFPATAPAETPTETAAPTSTPTAEPTDWISTHAYVTPSVASALIGQVISVTAERVITGTCDYPLYDVTLRQSEPLFAFIDPPTDVIDRPGSDRAVWKLAAFHSGVTTFTVAFYGETHCNGVWQWSYVWGQSQPVTVTGAIWGLPWVGKEP